MFSAPKFIQSDSTSGPSAIAQPMAPKIAAISSMVRLIGWIRPVSRGRGGSVGSSRLGRQARIEFGVFQFGAAGLDQGGQRVLELVQRGTALAALLGRGLAEVAQQAGQPAVAAEHGDAHRVPGAQVGGGGERGFGFGCRAERSSVMIAVPSWPRRLEPGRLVR